MSSFLLEERAPTRVSPRSRGPLMSAGDRRLTLRNALLRHSRECYHSNTGRQRECVAGHSVALFACNACHHLVCARHALCEHTPGKTPPVPPRIGVTPCMAPTICRTTYTGPALHVPPLTICIGGTCTSLSPQWFIAILSPLTLSGVTASSRPARGATRMQKPSHSARGEVI